MIICIEGVNGSGKTTLARAVSEQWISNTGLDAEVIEPVQMTEFGRGVRANIMREPNLDTEAESLAFASARLHACAELRSAADGAPERLLILERWAGAVVAYGRVACTDAELLGALEAVLTRALGIEHTFLLDVSGAVAADRLYGEPSANRFEDRGAAYLERVAFEYRSWATSRGVLVIEGHAGTLEEQARVVVDVLLATR